MRRNSECHKAVVSDSDVHKADEVNEGEIVQLDEVGEA